MQQKGFVSFQEGLAELLGFGLTSADLVDLQFVPNPANHSEVVPRDGTGGTDVGRMRRMAWSTS